MVRTLKTLQKSTRYRIHDTSIAEVYRTKYRKDGPLLDYVARYVSQRREAHKNGVTEYEGIMRLVENLPDPWSAWAKEEAELYTWYAFPDYTKVGDMHAFANDVLGALVDTKDETPPEDLVEPPTRKRARTAAKDPDSSNEEDGNEMVDKHMIETPPAPRRVADRTVEEEKEELRVN